MISVLDTNIILRFFTADKDIKYKNLRSFFNSIETGEINVVLKLIVLFQVIFVLKSFYKVPKEKIADGLTALINYKGIKIKEKKIVIRSLELWRKKNLEIVDCYLIACIEGDKQNVLYSYDRDFDKFSINRVEP
jgi:predicted nucleic acid-binding protein